MAREAAPDIRDCCFVFPNRRSQVFFGKYLAGAVKASGKPIVAPEMLTVNDFFARVSGGTVTDRVNLLLELYECYKVLNRKAEPLDEFIFWGDVILGDFDDVDKYRVDPAQLFRNVAEFREIQDSYSYLTENQRTAIGNFMRHFRAGGKLTVKLDADRPNVKERFLQIWNLLLPLYRDFRRRLTDKGMAYEGMIYRSLADRLAGKTDAEGGMPAGGESVAEVLREKFRSTRKFIFTGLNALNACEKTVMRKMRDAGIAEFCWDYSSKLVRDPLNKSSFFMSKNVEEFPQPFELDPEGLGTPEVEVVSVPSSAGQAKLVPAILASDSARGLMPEDTAVVLPDESLLLPVLNSIPPEVRDINVTMGYPMRSSAFFGFLQLVCAMQLHLRESGGRWYFYHSQVRSLFSSSLFRKITAGDAAAAEKVKAVKEGTKYYIPEDELSGQAAFDLLFRPVLKAPKTASKEQTGRFCSYLKTLVQGMAASLKGDADMALELEFAKRTFNAVNRLQAMDLEVLPLTFVRLLDQLLGAESVPFNGEPLKGLQIMGPLEMRALDFRNLVILSCNEGIFPHRSVSSSFIPPELRKGFGLPTYEHQDAVLAYYFYRMIQRAEKVWLVYDSRTEGVKTGEESRYIKQLEYHFDLSPVRRFVKAEARAKPDRTDVPKTEEQVAKLKEVLFSASALKQYLDCPAMFYFSKIAELEKENEVSEDLDAGMLGNVYHATMQALYLGEKAMEPSFDLSDRRANEAFPNPLQEITRDYLGGWLKRPEDIKARVRSLIKAELHSFEVAGRNLVVENVIVQYVLQTLRRDRELMERCGVGSFRIVGLEKMFRTEFDGFRFIGFIDRMDSFLPGELRIVDYKTGKVDDKEVDIHDGNAEEVAGLLFGPDNRTRPKIAFQLFLYDMLVGRLPEYAGSALVNSIYRPARLFTDPVKSVPASPAFNALVEERLHGLLAEMADTTLPWRRTDDAGTCSWCNFKMICGR